MSSHLGKDSQTQHPACSNGATPTKSLTFPQSVGNRARNGEGMERNGEEWRKGKQIDRNSVFIAK